MNKNKVKFSFSEEQPVSIAIRVHKELVNPEIIAEFTNRDGDLDFVYMSPSHAFCRTKDGVCIKCSIDQTK